MVKIADYYIFSTLMYEIFHTSLKFNSFKVYLNIFRKLNTYNVWRQWLQSN